MKTKTLLTLLLAAALPAFSGCSRESSSVSRQAAAPEPAASPHAGHDAMASMPGAMAAPEAGTEAWLAAAVAAYPLQTCVVSGEKLGGGMGPAFNYVHRQDGQPDRLVRFCCDGCVDEFKATPGKFLAQIDAAAAAAAPAHD